MLKRPRLTCPRCSQNLSYGTYCRHQRLPYCPGTLDPSSESESECDSTTGTIDPNSDHESESESDSTFCINSDSQSPSPVTGNSPSAFSDDYHALGESDTQHHDSQESGNTAPEVWSESE